MVDIKELSSQVRKSRFGSCESEQCDSGGVITEVKKVSFEDEEENYREVDMCKACFESRFRCCSFEDFDEDWLETFLG